MIHDPKYQSEKRRTREGLARLLGGDGNVDGAHELYFVDDKGIESKVALVQEDGWAMLPDTEVIVNF